MALGVSWEVDDYVAHVLSFSAMRCALPFVLEPFVESSFMMISALA